MGIKDLTPASLVLASFLVIACSLISLPFRLKLTFPLLIAGSRTVIQLLILGSVLGWVFSAKSLSSILMVFLVMLLAASHSALGRTQKKTRGLFFLSFLSFGVVSLLTSCFVTGVLIGVKPWYTPQYLIPLLGMILGNSLNGISLTLDTFLTEMVEKRGEIEGDLLLGATAYETFNRLLTRAMSKGMIPIVNMMSVVGLVSLPGMATGQILQGGDPMVAVRYQIMVMFMICFSTFFTSLTLMFMVFWKLKNNRENFNFHLIY